VREIEHPRRDVKRQQAAITRRSDQRILRGSRRAVRAFRARGAHEAQRCDGARACLWNARVAVGSGVRVELGIRPRVCAKADSGPAGERQRSNAARHQNKTTQDKPNHARNSTACTTNLRRRSTRCCRSLQTRKAHKGARLERERQMMIGTSKARTGRLEGATKQSRSLTGRQARAQLALRGARAERDAPVLAARAGGQPARWRLQTRRTPAAVAVAVAVRQHARNRAALQQSTLSVSRTVRSTRKQDAEGTDLGSRRARHAGRGTRGAGGATGGALHAGFVGGHSELAGNAATTQSAMWAHTSLSQGTNGAQDWDISEGRSKSTERGALTRKSRT
jgi:hypothetical protein